MTRYPLPRASHEPNQSRFGRPSDQSVHAFNTRRNAGGSIRNYALSRSETYPTIHFSAWFLWATAAVGWGLLLLIPSSARPAIYRAKFVTPHSAPRGAFSFWHPNSDDPDYRDSPAQLLSKFNFATSPKSSMICGALRIGPPAGARPKKRKRAGHSPRRVFRCAPLKPA